MPSTGLLTDLDHQDRLQSRMLRQKKAYRCVGLCLAPVELVSHRITVFSPVPYRDVIALT